MAVPVDEAETPFAAPATLGRRACSRIFLTMVAGALPGCGRSGRSGHLCSDVSRLTEAERELRFQTLGYVDDTSDPRSCRRCQQFSVVTGSPCGRCALIRGPIDPDGRCIKWAARE